MSTAPPHYVFVITFGRTGSTLLQGLLNSLDSVVVFGENEGFLLPLMDAYQALRKAHSHLKNRTDDRAPNAWYGSSRYSDDFLKVRFRSFVQRTLFALLPDGSQVAATTVGFKEIRHIFIGDNRLPPYLEFLSTIFPNSKLIFLTRDTDEVLASGWWAKNDPRFTRKEISEFNQVIDAFAKANPDRSLIIHYTDLVSGPETYMQVAEYLGATTDVVRYAEVVARNHSYDNRKITALLTHRACGIVLFEENWWRTRVDEFDIRVVVSGDTVTVDGILLFRSDVPRELRLKHGLQTVPLVFTVETPELNERFPLNPRAHRAGFTASFKIRSDCVQIQDLDQAVIAEASISAKD